MYQSQTQQLRAKSYFASSVPDAIEFAKKELGPDALLLKTRETPAEYRHLGPLEVVFGIASEPLMAEAPLTARNSMDEMQRRIEHIHQLLMRPTGDASTRPRATAPLESFLIRSGLPETKAKEIGEAVLSRVNRRTLDISRARRISDFEQESIERETAAELESRIATRQELARVTALVGPPGSGKTTTLVKLAVAEGLLKRRPVRLISADTERVGAAEQLRSFAAILGVPCESANTPAQLETAIAHTPENHLLLIDTPGYSPALFRARGADLANYFGRQKIDTQLVLTATMRHEAADSAVERFQAFRPSALVFTHLDEAGGLKAAAIEAIKREMPLSWLCSGQMVPEDIEAAAVSKLVAQLVNDLPLSLRSAA